MPRRPHAGPGMKSREGRFAKNNNPQQYAGKSFLAE